MNTDYVSIVSRQHLFFDLCEEGNTKVVSFASKKARTINLNDGFYGACKGGHMEIVNLLISMGANDLLSGFYYACKGGHIEIVNLLISKGINNWKVGLKGACEGGHTDIVEFMIDKGADNWNEGLMYACRGGHMDIVEFIIDKGADNWNNGLHEACYGGHMDIVQFMISKGADNWNSGFNNACVGHIDIAKLMASKGHVNWNHGLITAYFTGHMNIIDFILENSSEVDMTFYTFPFNNKKTKYFHNKRYSVSKNDKTFMHISILYWTIVYDVYSCKKKKNIVQKDLIPDLLKLLYF